MGILSCSSLAVVDQASRGADWPAKKTLLNYKKTKLAKQNKTHQLKGTKETCLLNNIDFKNWI